MGDPMTRRVEQGRIAREARRRGGLTQEDVAERAGLSVRAISNLERGRVERPRRHSLEAIADALGLTGEERAFFTRRAGAGLVGGLGPTPAQLPASPQSLTGRRTELAALDAVLAREGGVRVAAVHGGAGMGKTSLALAWARQVRTEFPDGQLFAQLRGYASTEPVSPGLVLHQFLEALHVPVAEIPVEQDARSALFRTVTNGRRLLVVLDDARDAEQVWPLLPAEPGCLVVVTSRSTLGPLSVRGGAEPVAVGPLEDGEAARLLTWIVGAATIDADPGATRRLLDRCAGSPLAISVVGQRVAAMPAADLAGIAAELDESLAAFDLEPDDESCSIRGVLTWSYAALAAEQARAFRLLSATPTPSLTTQAAAALLDRPPPATRRALEALAAVHLVDRLPGDRWRQHDLVHSYAAELHDRSRDAAAADPALERLFAHYLVAVDAATGTLAPYERPRRPALGVTAPHPRTFASDEAARAWLADELPAIVAVCERAGDSGRSDVALRLSNDLWSHLHYGALHDASLVVHHHAVRACQASGDVAGQCHALNNRGVAERRVGDLGAAGTSLLTALLLARGLGDDLLLGRALCNLGEVEMERGHLDQALTHFLAHLGLAEREDHPLRHCAALLNLAEVLERSGRFAEAAEHYGRALAAGDPPECEVARGFAHVGLGTTARRLGRDTDAEHHHRAALAIAESTVNRTLEHAALVSLGELLLERDQPREAAAHLERALAIARGAGERQGELRARTLLEDARRQTAMTQPAGA